MLAIETSGPLGSVALLEAGRVLAEQSLELGKKHAQSLIPTIQSVLAQGGKQARDVRLVAVSIGPGSYTGLRVGVTCAKTLAYAVNCPLVAVDTLLAIACNSPSKVSTVDVVADAQRGDVFVGHYARIATGLWIRSGEIRAVKAEDWAGELSDKHTVTGPGLEKYGGLAEGKCRKLPPQAWTPHATWVAMLGIGLLAEGQTADPREIEPHYLRRSSAEVQWERLHPGK
ncbi:MAG: tRNA (adenosine(37)-N6)-threonylcarbamoyltransferase complex dimerization subunit type 1 TsaB [Planctomycetia bacterium]|nr:tRNA (adenosine(37)-N6)-threonylcarbamoyltransferase complex dimerization subunit type 1 TsaB [Planctomycetia bacterium]